MTDPARLKPPTRLSPDQVRGIENPATVMLTPAAMGETASYWAHPNCPMLLGGIKVNTVMGPGMTSCMVSYQPTLIPRSWEERSFGVVLEYESDHKHAEFMFRLHYGCGDPSELRVGQTKLLTGKSLGKTRLTFALRGQYLAKGELFRAAIEVVRNTPLPVYLYGAWLEVGVD